MILRRLPRLAWVVAWMVLASVLTALLSGFFWRLDTLGAHDWDQMESHRYFVVRAIRAFGQFPFWDPYACGGFPAWGGAESATTVLSPLLPVYLALPLGSAIRVETATLLLALVVGCWFFARSYVAHPLSLAFVCLVGALNSRTALQAAVGHTWHMYYAGTPWVLGAFDRASALQGGASSGRRLYFIGLGSVVFALMVYGGGIYPVPHTALCLIGIALYRGCADRSRPRWAPAFIAMGIIAWGALLASPKLLAIAETMALFPRRVASPETIGPIWWGRMFLSSAQSFGRERQPGLDYLWHEYGQYIGPVPLVLLLWATIGPLRGGATLRSLRFIGWGFVVLALGGRVSPWGLLHLFPPFQSQHVPSRFTYVGVLLLSVVAAQVLERSVAMARARLGPRRSSVMDAGLWATFLLSAALIAREDRRCTAPWFRLPVPRVAEAREFFQYAEVPSSLSYGNGDPESPQGVNATPALLLHQANVGAIRCSAFNGLSQDAPAGVDGRPLHLGARGVGDPRYRGEYWVEPGGVADLLRWSPNEVVLSVRGGRIGDLVVYNQNWAPGWTANGEPTLNHEDVNAYRLVAPLETVTFRYRPRSLPVGLLLGAIGVLLGPSAWLLSRRRRGHATPLPAASQCRSDKASTVAR